MKSDKKATKSTKYTTNGNLDWIKVFNYLKQVQSYNTLKNAVMAIVKEGLPNVGHSGYLEMQSSDKIDEVACNFYPIDRPRNVYPIQTYGDGNCFP